MIWVKVFPLILYLFRGKKEESHSLAYILIICDSALFFSFFFWWTKCYVTWSYKIQSYEQSCKGYCRSQFANVWNIYRSQGPAVCMSFVPHSQYTNISILELNMHNVINMINNFVCMDIIHKGCRTDGLSSSIV